MVCLLYHTTVSRVAFGCHFFDLRMYFFFMYKNVNSKAKDSKMTDNGTLLGLSLVRVVFL